jgi:protein phosphatase
MDRIALISDIHGNMPALEATLEDISRRGVRRVLCLGDLVGKGPHSERAVDVCREACEIVVKGNWDEFIRDPTDIATLRWHQQRLGAERLHYLAGLPGSVDFTMSGKQIRLFHASHQGVHHRVIMNDTQDNQLAMFTNTDFTGFVQEPDVVGYGDIHRNYLKSFQHKVLFNVGSVGNPLDVTQASYCILEGRYGDTAASPFSIQMIRVPYDIELAIHQAAQEQMPQLELYADELRTARYRGNAPPAA